MPTKKTQPAAALEEAPSATENDTLTLEKKDNPKRLDRLNVPGMVDHVDGEDAGIAAWLFESGLTLEVQRNWIASPGDVITVGYLIGETNVVILGTKILEPGEETRNSYFFAAQQKDLPDGRYALVYLVNYKGGADYDMSYPLLTLVKTDLPAGDDNNQVEPGHSELKVSLSEKVIVPGNATKGVVVTLQPYPNHHPKDTVILHWGNVIISQTAAGPLQPTVIDVTYQHLVDAGDSPNMAVWLEVIDLVGNISTPGSATIRVSVDLDANAPDGPVFSDAGPVGYIDLELVDEKPVELQMHTPANVGLKDEIYDVMIRIYPPKGGVKVIHKFVPITRPGRVHSTFIDYVDVRAAAEGHIEVSFVLRKSVPPFEVYSKKNTAEVRGYIARLEAPSVEGYPNDHIADDPAHVIVSIPYYAWRQATDQIAVILRYVRSLNDVILHIETKEVGLSWPAGAPVKRLIYREQLQQFKGYRPEFYYVILATGFTRARAVNLNESLRRVLTIS